MAIICAFSYFETKNRNYEEKHHACDGDNHSRNLLFNEGKQRRKMSDLTLANIEALANNEFDNGYFCYGTGKVICPYSGQQVAGYFIRRNIE